MRTPPRPRQPIYDLYWYFASERQAIFERRIAGEPGPWTNDPILQAYKFCNVYRAADRVSQYLIRDVAYNTESGSPIDRLFQIVAFRMFSKPETWRGVQLLLGRSPTLEDLRSGSFVAALDEVKRRNRVIYTGAFILSATQSYGHSSKHHNHVELFSEMFVAGALGEQLLAATSFRQVYDLLIEYPLIGQFMAYQLAVDLNYSDLIDFSENEFTQAGPGALRGIKKAFVDLGDYTPAEVIQLMVEQQTDEFERLGLPFNGLWGRPLHAIDCQGLFCELDKYCREAAPELASARSRIKCRFARTSQPIILFFPPKWGINTHLPQHPVLGSIALSTNIVQRPLLRADQ